MIESKEMISSKKVSEKKIVDHSQARALSGDGDRQELSVGTLTLQVRETGSREAMDSSSKDGERVYRFVLTGLLNLR